MFQSWVVVLAFVAYVTYYTASLIVDADMRKDALDTGIGAWCVYLCGFFVIAYVSVMVTYCSAGVGNETCAAFGWLLASAIVLFVGACVVLDVFFRVKDGCTLWHTLMSSCTAPPSAPWSHGDAMASTIYDDDE